MSRRKRNTSPFSKNLASLMKEKELGVREAGRVAGVSHGTISNWCAGVTPDDFMAVKKLAKNLGVSFSWLMTGEDESRATASLPTVTEVFDDGGMLFSGFAEINIRRLIPRDKKKKGSED